MNNSNRTNNKVQEPSVNSKAWKGRIISAVAAVMAVSMASCETTGEHKNMVTGTVIGAGIGALSGARNGKAGRNAVIGGIAGAAAGAAKDTQEKKKREAEARRRAEWASKTPAEKKRIAQNETKMAGAFAEMFLGSALGGSSSSPGKCSYCNGSGIKYAGVQCSSCNGSGRRY